MRVDLNTPKWEFFVFESNSVERKKDIYSYKSQIEYLKNTHYRTI